MKHIHSLNTATFLVPSITLMMVVVILFFGNSMAYGQWTNFYFTDEWGDDTDDLAARSAYTKSARELPFPYQDRRMALIVDDCNNAWIRFDDGIVFGHLSGFKVRVDGKEIAVSASSSSDDRTDIYLHNDRRLILLLGGANRTEFLIPIHDERPARFNLNMNGSMRAVGKVCDFEKEILLARADSVRRARADSINRVRRARADSVRRARADSTRRAIQRRENRQKIFCAQDFVKNWFTQANQVNRRRFDVLKLRVNMFPDANRIVLDRGKWNNLSSEEKESVARGGFFSYMCRETLAQTTARKLNLDENNRIYIYSRRGRGADAVVVSMDIETGMINY